MKFMIQAVSEGLTYAKQELTAFLSRYTNVQFESMGDAAVRLYVDENLNNESYLLRGDGQTLEIFGANASAVLCGVYEALADAGVFFEPNGYSIPNGFDLQAFLSICKEVHPKCRLRGIRQHINFPMDISAYPLKDAKEYIYNLARMRMNAITFHSYGGQWHVCNPGEGEYAGNFFYGQRHPIPKDSPLASKLGNREVYCIPEAEMVYDNPKERDAYASYWLNELIAAAKEAYMTVTLSVELPSDDVAATTKMLKDVCDRYPRIDTLELISFECGERCEIELTAENMTEQTRMLLGDAALDENGKLKNDPGFVPYSYGGGIICLKRMLTALEHKADWMPKRGIDLRCGMYITNHDALRMLLPLMRSVLPKEVKMSFLAAHGACAVANSIAAMQLTNEDWQNTMIYSWAEFDGNMYIQQQASAGIYELLSQPKTDSIFGVCINHWRTAENMLALCYAADAAIKVEKPEVFYQKFAAKIGVENAEMFVAACKGMSELDLYCRDNLFNVGFCYVGCWINRKGVTRVRKYKAADLQYAKEQYAVLVETFDVLLSFARTEQSIAFLRLMINRCQCSVIHLNCMLEMALLKDAFEDCEKILDETGTLPEISDEERTILGKAYCEAMMYAMQYLDLYGQMMPDRGSAGNMISYYETLPVYINKLFESYLPQLHTRKIQNSLDAPPIPQEQKK